MLIRIHVIRKKSGKYEVEPKSWDKDEDHHNVKIEGISAMDIYGLLVDAIQNYNRGIDDGEGGAP